MKKINKALKKSATLSLIIVAFVSCEKEFSSLGTEVIGGTNFETVSEKYPTITYNKGVDPVRTDASSTVNPNFGTEVVLDSVVLTVPYFTSVIDTDEEGVQEYRLDSIFGTSPMKLSAFRNNYYLRDFDPDSNFEEPQRYYSDGTTSETGMINMAELEGDLLFELESYVPTSNEIVLFGEPDAVTGEREETSRIAPALRVVLDNDYWQQAIIDMEGETELSNAANFRNYFRGIYFKTEPIIGDEGTMMLIDFRASANITLYYTKDGFGDDTDGNPTREQSTYVLNFSGNRVNFLDNDYNFPLEDGDDINGDQNLFLKGGVGSTAVVNLFNGDDLGESAEYTAFKDAFVETDSNGEFVKSKRLVNEANLVFYVDQSLVEGQEPNRLYLYDLTNKIPLRDYFLDLSTNNFNAENTKILHSEPLERVDEDDPDSEGVKYKIKITEHINNLLIRDSTNVKLGLAVAGNLNLEDGVDQYNIITEDENLLDRLPLTTIITPRGTVLHGSNTADQSKKVELEIFYTEPNN